MLVGVPKEIKDHEYRVGLVPSSVAELVRHGHTVLIESGAGVQTGLSDDDYRAAGGRIVDGADQIFAEAELIVKVKEPLAAERKKLRRGQVLFTYLHLAPDLAQTRDLMASGATCIAYETVTSPSGGLPLLTPMSEVAGRLAPQAGAHCLEFDSIDPGRTQRSARRRWRTNSRSWVSEPLVTPLWSDRAARNASSISRATRSRCGAMARPRGVTDTFGLRVNSWPPSCVSSRLMQQVREGWDTPQRRAARVKFSSSTRARKYRMC